MSVCVNVSVDDGYSDGDGDGVASAYVLPYEGEGPVCDSDRGMLRIETCRENAQSSVEACDWRVGGQSLGYYTI